jgi:hypothetical protein
MKNSPSCGSKKFWYLSTGQIRYSNCALTKKVDLVNEQSKEKELTFFYRMK